MSKLVSLNSRKFLGTYIEQQDRQRIPDGALFLCGVLATVGMPESTFIAHMGFTSFVVLASTLAVGVMAGITIFRWFPCRFTSVVVSSYPQTPLNEEVNLKPAA